MAALRRRLARADHRLRRRRRASPRARGTPPARDRRAPGPRRDPRPRRPATPRREPAARGVGSSRGRDLRDLVRSAARRRHDRGISDSLRRRLAGPRPARARVRGLRRPRVGGSLRNRSRTDRGKDRTGSVAQGRVGGNAPAGLHAARRPGRRPDRVDGHAPRRGRPHDAHFVAGSLRGSRVRSRGQARGVARSFATGLHRQDGPSLFRGRPRESAGAAGRSRGRPGADAARAELGNAGVGADRRIQGAFRRAAPGGSEHRDPRILRRARHAARARARLLRERRQRRQRCRHRERGDGPQVLAGPEPPRPARQGHRARLQRRRGDRRGARHPDAQPSRSRQSRSCTCRCRSSTCRA